MEDHPVFRQGLVQMINHEEDLTVCGESGDAETALRSISRLRPDVVLVDISLPRKSGLGLIKELRASNSKAKCLVISMHDEALYANRVLRAGGDGYIMKQEDPEEILTAIRDVLRGHTYVSEAVLRSTAKGALSRAAPKVNRPLDRLADSELEILEMLGWGKSIQEIARQSRLKPAAVETRLRAMRKKLNLTTANALVRYAVCWVESGEG